MNFLNNNRWLAIIILLLLTANVVTLGYLWTHKNNTIFNDPAQQLPPPPQGQVFEFVTKELQLDSAQQKAYKLLRDEHQAGQRPLQDSIRKAKDNFFALLQQAAPDSLIELRSAIIARAEQQLDLFTFKHFQQLRAICNPTQQNKFDSIIQGVLRRMAPGRMHEGPPPQMQQQQTAPGKTQQPDKSKEDFRRPPPRLGPDGRPLPPPPGMEGMPPPPRGERPGPDGKRLPPPDEPPPGGG